MLGDDPKFIVDGLCGLPSDQYQHVRRSLYRQGSQERGPCFLTRLTQFIELIIFSCIL